MPTGSRSQLRPALGADTEPGHQARVRKGRGGGGLPRQLLSSADWRAIGLLLGLPLLLLGAPALAGYPLLTGDDVIQNLPLQSYAGAVLAHGHLPTFDPYLWSGTPLLGGINAHPFFPTTALFVVLPSLTAWVLAEAAAFGAAATGVYVLLRLTSVAPLPATLGAVTFGFAGFATSQAVHIGFLDGSAALVWALVALEGLARGRPERRSAWSLLLAGATALVGLAGSPNLVLPATLTALSLFIALIWSEAPRRWSLVGHAVVAGGIGLLVSAPQWLVGADFVAISERAAVSAAYSAAGSLKASELLLLLVPHLLGGGPLGLASYAGNYNMAELDAYVGILALAAVLGLLSRITTPGAKRARVWFVVLGLGIVLALGSHTPIQSLIHRLPIVRDERLPSRALILVDLALAVLLGYWADDLLKEPRRPGLRLDLELVAPLCVLGVVVATVAVGRPFARFVSGSLAPVWSRAAVAPYLVVTVVLAIVVCGFLLLATRLTPRGRAVVLSAIVAADLVVFLANQSSLAPIDAGAVGPPTTLSSTLATRLSPNGRFAIVDPARDGGIALDRIGAPDLNLFHHLGSVQGYGALTWGPYADETGSHGQDVLAPRVLRSSLARELDLKIVLTVPSELLGNSPAIVSLDRGGTIERYFGETVPVTEVTLRAVSTRVGPGEIARLTRAATTLRLVLATGRLSSDVPRLEIDRRGRDVRADFVGGARAVGLRLAGDTRRTLRLKLSVRTADGTLLRPSGPLAAMLTAPTWEPEGTIGPLAVFEDRSVRGEYFAAPGAKGLVVESETISAYSPTASVTVVALRRSTLVRSVADLPGWQATLTHSGHSSPVRLDRYGLVQAVVVPRGRSVVTFSYDAPGLGSSLELGGLGLVLAVLAVLVQAVLARKKPADH